MSRPISTRTSSVWTMIFRILAGMVAPGVVDCALVSRHRSSVGLRWPSKRSAALHRLPIRSAWAARCALRCAPMAARSLRHLIGDATLAQTVPLADVGGCQAADASMDARAGGHGQDDDEFIGRRRAGRAQLGGVEVAAHIAGVDMGQRHIQRATRRADLLRGRHDGQGIGALPAAPGALGVLGALGAVGASGIGAALCLPTQQLAHRIAPGDMPQRAMFELARRADDGALAIALDAPGRHRHRLEQAPGQVQAHILQRIHQRQNVLLVPARIRIAQHRSDGAAQQRPVGDRAEFVADVLQLGENTPDADHGSDLCKCNGWCKDRAGAAAMDGGGPATNGAAATNGCAAMAGAAVATHWRWQTSKAHHSRPSDCNRCAFSSPCRSAWRTCPAGSAGTATLTGGAPGSLSARTCQAGMRPMRSSGTSTALATMVAAASASAAVRANTVTLSAIPTHSPTPAPGLRPPQPLVATPRTGIALRMRNWPSGNKPLRSCAASSAAMSEQMPTLADAPAAIGVMKPARYALQAAHMRRATTPRSAQPAPTGARSAGNSSTNSCNRPAKRSQARSWARATARPSPRASMIRSIGPC